ncbi:hypothetical protein GCM10023091_09700 [Ravibacter arvi]|uniref:DinB-like domain-containing protein n=1 Tax=Ravibacter arvi TaxID=2051041 RepID=A0ABP8LSN0_9BACT
MDNRDETLRIIDLINDTYESEEAWHGPSLVGSLRDISPALAEARLTPNTHSIAEIVYHLTTWRIFVARKLQGDKDFEIRTPEKDWKVFGMVDEFEWETLQMELSLSQDELVSLLEQTEDDAYLEELVPGKNYSYYTLLHGIIHHDLYHAGQISLIKKGLTLRNFEERDVDTFDSDYGYGQDPY